MKIYYSGATKFNQPQLDSLKSVGGFISSSEVPNDVLGNLFGDISKNLIWNSQHRTEYRAIVLHNDSASTILGLKVFLQFPTEDSDDSDADSSTWQGDFKAAYESPLADSCGDLYLSSSSGTSQPFGLTFSNVDGLARAMTLPNLAPDAYLGIWLSRAIRSTVKAPLTDDEYLAILAGTLVLPTVEQVTVVFQYN